MRKRMHVAMFTPTAAGGHARYTHELLMALAERGKERGIGVSLITSTNLDRAFWSETYPIRAVLPPVAPRESFPNLAVWAVSRPLFYLRRDRLFREIAVRERVDAIHVQEYTPWMAPLDFRRLRRRGIKVVATVHNIRWNAHPPLIPRWLPDRCNHLAWRRCDALFVHTETLRDELAATLGHGHPPIYVTPHGTWQAPAPARTAADVAARLARRNLLFFGIISAYKGVDVLLEALRLLPDCRLVIAGAPHDAEYIAQVRALAATFPPERVRLLDRFIAQEEIASLFAESTLVVLPYTHFTAQSGVLHDALAWGVPVVGTDVGAIGESINRWGIGRVAPPRNAAGLAAAIQAALEPVAYQRALAALDRAREETSWGTAASRVLDAYEAVIRGDR